MALILKVKLGDETRRITLDHLPTYSELVNVCEKLFSRSNLVIKYTDEDNDLVTVSSDVELAEAFNVMKNLKTNILRITLSASSDAKKAETTPTTPSPPSTAPPFVDIELCRIPIGQLLNPQFISTFLSNPELVKKVTELLQNIQAQRGNNPPMAELAVLFQNLGLSQSTAGQPMEQAFEQLSSFIQEISSKLSSSISSQMGTTPAAKPPSSPCCGEKKSEEGSAAVHSGVTCDGCGKANFAGIRYKCAVCPDFDFCETCEAKRAHEPSHHFIKIVNPINYGRGCPYFRAGASARPHKPPMSVPNPSRFLARFVEDVTVPDGTISPPGLKFVKIWKLRNEGTLPWPENVRLLFVGGDKLSPFDSVAVPAIPAGQEVDVAVDMMTPAQPGRYVSYWRLALPDGSRFGQRVWVDLLVMPVEKLSEPPKTASPSSTATAPLTAPLTAPSAPLTAPATPATPAPPPSAPLATAMDFEPSKEQASAPAPSPVVQQILDMGFHDRQLIEELLVKYDNDVLRTVQDLLNRK
jgi:hypothetical protein